MLDTFPAADEPSAAHHIAFTSTPGETAPATAFATQPVVTVQDSANKTVSATGNVTLTTGPEAAEAEKASYVVATGIVEMEGDVLLTQGPNALSGEKLYIDFNAGTGRMAGRVKTIFTPQSGQPAGSRPGSQTGGTRT